MKNFVDYVVMGTAIYVGWVLGGLLVAFVRGL